MTGIRPIARTLAALLVAIPVAWIVNSGAAQQATPPQASQSLTTVSYPLFEVDGSGVTGHLQVVEQVTGGTELILTMQGMVEGRTYPAAIYVGSCGPDRPLHLELEPVGRENDPFVSITESTFTVDDFSKGEYFVYVFDGDTIDLPDDEGLDVPALACGEVGLGALEGQP
jgi:hypothetical protein